MQLNQIYLCPKSKAIISHMQHNELNNISVLDMQNYVILTET